MYKIDLKAYYRLTDVQDHEGNSKVQTRDLYMDRINCIGTNLRVEPWHGACEVMRMDFVYDPRDVPIYRRLRTSPIIELQIHENSIHIWTMNSLYILEHVEPPEVKYQDVACLIELYLNNESFNFAAGYYYDEKKQPHKLDCHIHVGMIADSCLIYFNGGTVCRYFPHISGVVFYNTIYKQQDYSVPILIHNVAKEPLRIKFEGFSAVWTITPGQAKTIRPYCRDGADEET